MSNIYSHTILTITPAVPVTDNNAAYKNFVLSYPNNSSRLTKNQLYSQTIRGNMYKKVWATQSQTYTNPNTNNLERVGNVLVCGTSTTQTQK